MPKGVRRHVGPVGVLLPALGCPLPLSPAAPRVSELSRASAVSRLTASSALPLESHPAGVGGRRPLPFVEARRRAGRELGDGTQNSVLS